MVSGAGFAVGVFSAASVLSAGAGSAGSVGSAGAGFAGSFLDPVKKGRAKVVIKLKRTIPPKA